MLRHAGTGHRERRVPRGDDRRSGFHVVDSNDREPRHSPMLIEGRLVSSTSSSAEAVVGGAFAGVAVTVALHMARPRSTKAWLTCTSDGKGSAVRQDAKVGCRVSSPWRSHTHPFGKAPVGPFNSELGGATGDQSWESKRSERRCPH